MGQLDLKRDTILKFFLNNPTQEFHIRELSRLTGVPKTTVQRTILELLNRKLIVREKKGVFNSYLANETYFWYKFYKKQYLLEEIYVSGVVSFLEDYFNPQCIILFGSGAKGEYVKDSDVDLFLFSLEKNVSVVRYEHKLKRKINIIFKTNYNELSPELFNNIINGVKLSGYIKLK